MATYFKIFIASFQKKKALRRQAHYLSCSTLKPRGLAQAWHIIGAQHISFKGMNEETEMLVLIMESPLAGSPRTNFLAIFSQDWGGGLGVRERRERSLLSKAGWVGSSCLALPVAQLPLTCAVHLQGPESDKELMTNPDS